MHTKRLLTNADLTAFQDAYLTNDGTAVPLEYLQRSAVWGCYRNNRLVAGFIVNRSLPLRYFEPHPVDFGPERFPTDQSLSNIAEITCIWHEKKTYFPISDKVELYLQSILKTITWQAWQRNTAILGGSLEEKVARRQRTLLCRLLYQGPVVINGELKTVQLYYAPARLVILRFPMALAIMLAQETSKAVGRWARGLRKRMHLPTDGIPDKNRSTI